MSKYWERLVKSNPALEDENAKMTISVGQFKKQIEKAYRTGSEDKAEVAKAFSKIEPERRDSGLDLFSSMFGNL